MRYVILRDDDTNALTPPGYLERLYRPFFDRGLVVNLAVIPNVRTDVTYGQNILEGFLVTRNGTKEKMLPVGANPALVEYLLANPGYHLAQHGYNHEFIHGACEFEQHARHDIARRLDQGKRLFTEAHLSEPVTFVAPYDRFTRTSLREVARRFRVISTAWFEWRRLPLVWWPAYLLKKIRRRNHWRAHGTILLSHPPCHLSFRRPYTTMLADIKRSIASQHLTVLVAHWWEFFPDQQPDEPFIAVLHALAEYLHQAECIRTVAFDDVARGYVPLS
jgi:hypothetical protein